ncbi:MAG: OmpA family protein [Alphaproteobacteria bacterium]|nr:OmpA family protein [Alphaproteobacteria bacterium]
MRFSIAAGLALALLWAAPSFAQGVSADEANSIIRSLAPSASAPASAESYPRTAREVVVQNSVVVIDTAHSLDFEVYFPFDSARLMPQAHVDLWALGEALASPQLRQHIYLIAGHTDGVGSAAYNLDLSARRAASVRRFLIDSFAIDPRRLIAVGFGESQLKAPQAPTAGINRRVEVALVLSRGD